MTILQTERTVMRPHQLADFEALAAMWGDPAVTQYILDTPETEHQSWCRLLRNIGHWSAIGYGFWVVTDRETGAILGEVGFGDLRRGVDPALARIPEIGWVLSPSAHGKGLATEAATAALEWGDQNLPGTRTVCLFNPDNVGSIRVASKIGYAPFMDAIDGGKPVHVRMRERPAAD